MRQVGYGPELKWCVISQHLNDKIRVHNWRSKQETERPTDRASVRPFPSDLRKETNDRRLIIARTDLTSKPKELLYQLPAQEGAVDMAQSV